MSLSVYTSWPVVFVCVHFQVSKHMRSRNSSDGRWSCKQFNPLRTARSKIDRRRSIKFRQLLCYYFSKELYKKDVIEKVSSWCKHEKWCRYSRGRLKWPNASIYAGFRGRAIDKRGSRLRRRSLHCYGSSKRRGMYIANDGKKTSCRLAKEPSPGIAIEWRQW